MSNASNLSNLANVLDDGTSGQVLTSQGNGVATFADAGGTGVTVHTNQATMLTDAASADEGSLHYENANNKLYVKQSSGFFLLASITNTAPTVSSFTETTGSGSASAIADNGTFVLTSGSNTVITLTATDPDLETLVYSATVTSGTASNVISSPSLPISNQSSNTFTLTPVTSGTGGTITIRFDVSDGNNVVNKTHSFSMTFKVVDSNYTTLLATATGTSDNKNITDSSSNTHSITVNGDAYAGTFSPYRSGGYSTYFDGTNGLMAPTATGTTLQGDTTFTVEFWYNTKTVASGNKVIWGSRSNSSNSNNDDTIGRMFQTGGSLYYDVNGSTVLNVSSVISANTWHYIALVVDSGAVSLYLDGARIATGTYTSANGSDRIIVGHTANTPQQYIADFRINTAAEYSGTSHTVPTEPLLTTSDTVFHLPTKGYLATDLILTGTPSKTPFSPYDYDEYDAADHGGSVYFDRASYNSGACITVADHNDFTLGTSNWTIKFWVYHNELDTASGTAYGYFSNYYFNTPGGFGLKWMQQWGNKPVLEYMNSGSYAKKIFDFVPSAKTWYYYELTCSSSTVTLKVNGETIGTQSMPDLGNPDRTLIVGAASNGSSGVENFLGGYIADFQYVIGGTASESSVPTAPMSTNTNAKLHIKGTDASIIDKSQGTNLKLVGNTTGSTTTKFTGAKSMYFDGNGDYADLTIEPIGAGDFTVEFWVNDDGSGNNAQQEFSGYLSLASGGSQSTGIFFSRYNFMVGGNSTVWGSAFPNTFTATHGTGWSHIAMCRSGTTVKVYVDGTLEHTVTGVSSDLTNTDLRIASRWNDNLSYLCPCYIQDLRISKGKARYTASDETSNIPSAPLEA